MNTTISLPDDLFAKADKLAKKLGQSRSEFYVQALRLFVDQKMRSDVTNKLNAVYEKNDSVLEEDVKKLQNLGIKKILKRKLVISG
jgi:metal-responsive CopG/Arc/MetJ family transcriptional regulator